MTQADDQGPAFQVIRARFVAGLPARWQELEEATNLDQVRMTLHRLSGVAGSYGYQHIGDLCVALSAGLNDPLEMRASPCYIKLGEAIEEAVSQKRAPES